MNSKVAEHAARHDVLILRGIDVYGLLGRALAGEPVGEKLVDMLGSGGGWLEVTDSTFTLHPGAEPPPKGAEAEWLGTAFRPLHGR